MADYEDERLGPVHHLFRSIGNGLASGFQYMWTRFGELLPNYTTTVIDKVTEFLGKTEDGAWDNLLESYSNQGLLTDEQVELLKPLKNLTSPMDLLAYVYLSINLLGSLLSTNTEIGGNFLRQALNKQTRSMLPDYREILNAAFIAPEKTNEVRETMRKLGLPEDQIDLIFLSAYRLYNEDTIRTLFLRGELSNEQTIMRLRELGYTDTRIDELVKTWEVIPPIQDIITMVAKEAFEPDIVEKIGLDAEFPTEQSDWLKKQGLSDFWQHNYWRAHWDQPSIQMAFEMLHREDPDNPGNSIIDKETLDMMFRIVEIPPFWRDKLTKIAYQPYTRVDVRRMHELGVINDQQLIQSYKDLGYDDEHALNMANFTLLYNAQNDKDISQSQILRSYNGGLISRSDALSLLQQLGFNEPRADFILTVAEYEKVLDFQDQIVDNIKEKYQDNLIDKIEAQNMLGQLNLPAEQTKLYLDTWEIKRLNNVKKPSKTDLDKFLRNKVISVDQYRIEMQRLGYGWTYIDWYQKLVDLKKAG